MKWIIFFAKNKIPYYVYKLYTEDKIILNSINNKDKVIIVLDGIIILTKIVHNDTKLTMAVLEKNNIFINPKSKKKIYYEIKAVSNTYIIILNEKLFRQKRIHNDIDIMKGYYKTIDKYEETIMITNEKNSKKRIILLILSMFIQFGRIIKNNIIISFDLSEKNIAIITNTSISTVSKTINNLERININRKKNRKIQTLTIKSQS